MLTVITTEWYLWVIKRSGSASKELTLPSLTFTEVEIKAPLQKIYGNSDVQSAKVFVRCLALTHAHVHTEPHTHALAAWPAGDVQVLSVILGEDSVGALVRTCQNPKGLLHSLGSFKTDQKKKKRVIFFLSWKACQVGPEDKSAFNPQVPVSPKTPHHGSPLIR